MDLYKVRQDLNLGIPLSKINLKVTFYSRVSTDSINQHSSLINQSKYFVEMINNNPNWELIPGYIDDGISGTSAIKRNNFMKMINEAKKHKFDLIITKEISRFSRNTLDSIKYTRLLLSYNVAVLFLNDNINTALPDSELRLTIMASMAQDEIRRLSERVKFGMKSSIKKGTILGNNMLYGYRKNKVTGNLEINKKESLIVKKIFNYYLLNNYSINKIINILNNKNIKTIQNKKWSISTISRMLSNPKYKGYYCGGKSEVIDYINKKVIKVPEDKWTIYKDNIKIPPIVNENIWNKVNNKLKQKHNLNNNKNNYSLSNKIYCKNCLSVFHRRRQCKKTNDITWLCSKYLKEGKKICSSVNIRESEIYKIIDKLFIYLNLEYKNIINNLCSFYPNVYKNEVINICSKNVIRNTLLNIALNKMLVSKIENNKDYIKLDIYLKLNNESYKYQDEYEFNRGYNTCGTRRYKIKYKVELFFIS